MVTEKFNVPGISCQHCVRAITDEVSEIAGVQKVHAVLDDKTVTVEHSDDVSTAQIVEAINEAGYDEVTKL